METEFAPAKVNLTLHVTGQRADGYHLLDSLVVFASIGDTVTARAADQLSLTITGPQAAGLPVSDDNLVLRAARLMGGGAEVSLEKRLPIASGIGGGSADAAATLRLMTRLRNVPLPDAQAVLGLGADVPVCLVGRAVRMTGVGDSITPVPALPPLDIVLINPGVAVSTPAVFRALHRRDHAPMPTDLPSWPDARSFADWLALQRNDLQAAAISLAPSIAEVLVAIRQTGCLYAGMSGSGATCFGLYPPDGHSAKAACAQVARAQPTWWAEAGSLS